MVANLRFVGVDGEGEGRNPHRYTLLAMSDATGEFQHCIEDPKGLSSKACLGFLADMAFEYEDLQAFSFAFTYDITKMLQDVPDPIIYRLMRPDERKHITRRGREEPTEQIWGPFRLNYFGTMFRVRRGRRNGERSKEKGLVVWDVFKFFQSSFVKALQAWNVGQEDLDFIERMKAARGEFDKTDSEQIKTYCFYECRHLATLVEKLTKAHFDAGLRLKSYFGAGSTAGALLDTMGIKQKTSNEILYSLEPIGPYTMADGVARAFFGGRFENSVVGPVEQDIYSYDISSAYPYQIAQLPCLEHGLWRKTDNVNDLRHVRAALVGWAGATKPVHRLWGPLPFRFGGGTIIFPASGGNGFCYKDEFLVAQEFGARFMGAWILDQDCDCHPFKDIPRYYNERCRIGKDGPGIVLKLGVNACYGKLAQSVGNPQYSSWIWAGMTTSGCRAQLLQSMLCHSTTDNLFAIATDGIYSNERLILPTPIDTDTNGYGKPLGGWEEKIVPGGMFFARPGVNFALNAPKDISAMRGRGYGRKVIMEHHKLIMDTYERGEPMVMFPNVERFKGAKTSINQAEGRGLKQIHRYTRSPNYGEWISEPMRLSFDPAPKRNERIGNRLTVYNLPSNVMSSKYERVTAEERVDAYAGADFDDIVGEQPQ